MPIYEYRCESCGHELEKLQRMSDEPLRDCPSCEEPQLRRLVSAAGFRLKGSGWYETDFKRDNRRNLADGATDGKQGDGAGDGQAAGAKAGTGNDKAGKDGAGKASATDSATPKKKSAGESQPSSAA